MQSRASEVSGLTTVVDRIRYWASTHPEREAFVFRRHDGSRFPLSRAAYLRLATRFAARLQSLGLQHGDVVCNCLVNSPERLVTDLGIMLSGAVPMSAAPILADGADVKGCLQKARAKALIVDPEQKDGAWDVCQKVLHPCQAGPYRSEDLPDLKQVLFSRRSEQGDLLLFEELEASTEEFRSVTIRPEDLGYIFATSGSTGYSKPAMHTQASLHHIFADSPPFFRLEAESRFWTDSHVGWIGGFPYLQIYNDYVRVLPDKRAGLPIDHVEFVWKSIAEEKVSIALFYPTFIQMSLQRPELWRGVHELKSTFTGAQVVPRECIKALSLSGGFTARLTVLYGATEAGFIAYADYDSESQFEDFMAEHIAPGVKIRLVDDSGNDVPNGEQGEIQVKSRSLAKGYVGDEEATKKVFTKDGWYRTDDLGYFDARGRLFILGRKSDVINKGPSVWVPQFLEVRIRQCPGVKDVVVVPVPDKELINEICACIQREEGNDVTEAEVDEYCRGLFLSSHQGESGAKPRYYLFFDEFPVNDNQKLDRKRLKEAAAKKLGLK